MSTPTMRGCATGLTVEQVAERYGHEDAHAVEAFARFLHAVGRAPRVDVDLDTGRPTRPPIPAAWGPYTLGLADDVVELLPVVHAPRCTR